MAEQLESFKKIWTKKYIKTGTTPVFTGELEKLRGHCDAFVEYNASKKVYQHTLGQGGYKLAIPKWEKIEQDLLDRGILKRPLIREDLNVIQNTSPRRLMPHLLHQMVQNRTNLGGHSIQIIIIINQATT